MAHEKMPGKLLFLKHEVVFSPYNYEYEATCDLKLVSRNVIMHVLFPIAFVVQQLFKFRLNGSWRANCA